jgi:hypothetical protein
MWLGGNINVLSFTGEIMVALVQTILVVLGLPKTVAAILIRVKAILDAMTANKTTFTAPPVALATAQAHLDALASAEAAFKSKTGSKVARDAALQLVVEDAKQLHAYVQQLANATPSQAALIAQQAAMALFKKVPKTKADLSVKQTVSGILRVVAKGLKGAKAHDWEYSTDGGKTWTAAPSTTKGSTTITGLAPATTVQVRHRALTKSGSTDWSAVVTAVVS